MNVFHAPSVRISTQGRGGKEALFESITANISSGGVFISTTDPLPVASKVYLEFLIDFEDLKKLRFPLSLESLRNYQGKPVWVNVSGVVIRHQEDGMAVIYDDDYQLSPSERLRPNKRSPFYKSQNTPLFFQFFLHQTKAS